MIGHGHALCIPSRPRQQNNSKKIKVEISYAKKEKKIGAVKNNKKDIFIFARNVFHFSCWSITLKIKPTEDADETIR